MGAYDRDYWQTPPARRTPFGGMRMWSVTTWIIVINVAVFVLDQLLERAGIGPAIAVNTFEGPVYFHAAPLEWWGHFSASTAIFHLQLWRFITFQFLHAGGWHLFVNMLGLFYFGPMLEGYLGSRRFLAFYLLCGVGGAVSYLVLWGTHILIENPSVHLIGASAGIFGVLIAAAQIAPDTTVLIYGIFPMRLRAMAWVLLAIAAYTVFFNGRNAGGEASHLGGAAVGALLIRSPNLLNFFDLPRRPRMRIHSRDW